MSEARTERLKAFLTEVLAERQLDTEIDPEVPLLELGLNSLMIIDYFTAVEGKLPFELSLMPFLIEDPSLSDLSEFMLEDLEEAEFGQLDALLAERAGA